MMTIVIASMGTVVGVQRADERLPNIRNFVGE
jgi:hypothetical protein